MKQKDIQLLLKDLCSRLPYSVKCEIDDIDEPLELESIKFKGDCFIFCNGVYERYITEIKPYLRSMSDMTKEEKKELLCTIVGKNAVKHFQILSDGSIENTDAKEQNLQNFSMHWINFDVFNTTSYIDWLNAHHFDYRDLIERGLALPAPEGMYNV